MAENEKPVGYRFHPTDSELIYHLKNKIRGDSCEAINEININDYDPASLRSLSKIQSNDPTWYFFARAVFMSSNRTLRKRITKSGLWKPTGKDREIKDKNGKKIGLKKTLVYHERAHKSVKKKKKETLVYHELGAPKTVKKKNKKNPWVMHEYHIQCWSHPDMESYVICKIKYKGEEDGGIPSSEPSQSLVSDLIINNTPLQIEQPCDEENGLSIDDLAIPIMNEQVEDLDPNTFFDGLSENDLAIPIMNERYEEFDPNTFFDGLPENDLAMSMNEPEPEQEVQWDADVPNTWFIMQEDCNDYQPRKPLTGIIVDYSSDDDDDDSEEDAESISVTSYQGSLSPGDSVGSSSNKHFPSCRDETLSSSTDSCKDLQTSSGDSSITRENTETQLAERTVGLKQEVKTEKEEGLFLGEKAIEKTTHKKNSKYVYLMKMIIGFILLMALFGSNIISV